MFNSQFKNLLNAFFSEFFYLNSADIIEKSGNKDVSIVKLDLASLASVRKCAAEIIKNEPRLDILINNAGCADFGKEATEDGLEYQMQINHFGHFLFTHLLLGWLKIFLPLVVYMIACI